jgi:hypothetical protein
VIVAPDDMRDLHGDVVDDDCEIIGRSVIGAQDDQIIQLAVLKRQFAVNEVDETSLPLQRRLQADRRFAISWRVLQIAAAAVISRRFTTPQCLFASLL